MKYLQQIVVFLFAVIPFLSYANDIFRDIKDGDLEAIEARISRGEDINQVDEFGLSALWYAARYQQIEMVQLLLDNGADVHARDHKMRATIIDSLHNFISRSGQERLEKIEHAKRNGLSQSLIDNSYPARTPDGIDFTESGAESWKSILTLIESSIEVSDDEIESHEELDQPDQVNSDIQAMAELLDKGYDINIQDANGETMLMRAVEKGSPGMVRYLLERGIDPELRDHEGRTAFEYVDAISNEDLKQRMTIAFDVSDHDNQDEAEHQRSGKASEIVEVIGEVTPPKPAKEEPAEAAPVEVTEETPEQSSNWWLWLVGALVVVGGLGLAIRRKS